MELCVEIIPISLQTDSPLSKDKLQLWNIQTNWIALADPRPCRLLVPTKDPENYLFMFIYRKTKSQSQLINNENEGSSEWIL